MPRIVDSEEQLSFDETPSDTGQTIIDPVKEAIANELMGIAQGLIESADPQDAQAKESLESAAQSLNDAQARIAWVREFR